MTTLALSLARQGVQPHFHDPMLSNNASDPMNMAVSSITAYIPFFKIGENSCLWWHTPITPELERCRQEDQEFKAIANYMAFCFKK